MNTADLLKSINTTNFSDTFIEISNDSFVGFNIIDNFFSATELISDKILKKEKRKEFLMTCYFHEKEINTEAYLNISDRLKDTIDESIYCIGSKDTDGLINARNTFSDIKKEINALEAELYTDSLTKLNNKRYLDKKILNKEGMFKKNGYLYLFDIRNMKNIINSYGRNTSNNLLVLFSNSLIKGLENLLDKVVLIRTYDDEFIILSNEPDIAKDILKCLLEVRIELLKKIITLKASNERLSLELDIYFKDYTSKDLYDNILDTKKTIILTK